MSDSPLSPDTVPPSPKSAIDEAAIIDALWALVADRGWSGVTFQDLAAHSGNDLASLRHAYPTKFHLLAAHARGVDEAMLRDAAGPGGGSARDRIFDALMRRLDLLQPHRTGLIRFGRDLRRDPLLGLALAPVLGASMAWTLEAAGVSACGVAGVLRVKGLCAVWLATLRSWEQDESIDLGPTMAALDRALDRAERVARTLRLAEADELHGGGSNPHPT